MTIQKHPMWRSPQHHLDVESRHDHVHWIELFYDLIHVVIIFLLGNLLSHHLSLSGFLLFAGLFTAFWFAWADTSIFNSLYVSTDVIHRLLMACLIVTAMIMAAAIPSIAHQGWHFFAFAFALNRVIIAYLYFRTDRLGVEASNLAHKISRHFMALAAIFALSACIPAPYSYMLFGIGIIAIQLLYMLPRVGALNNPRFIPRLGHMAERFSLLLLIVVGEGFFKLVLGLADKGVFHVSADVLLNFIIGGVSVFVLCWIYFDFVGNGKPKNNDKSTLVNWWLAHLVLMMSAVMVGVALSGEVKVGMWESYPLKYAILGCLGLILYFLSLLWIQFAIEPRVAHQFATKNVRLVGILLALTTLFSIPFVPAIVSNLLWMIALFSQIAIPITRAYLTFSKQPE